MPAKWQTWMPRVIDAWCGSRNVQGLSDPAYRAFDHLLMAEWQSEDGMIPQDDKYLAKASGMFSRWPEVRDEVLELFQRDGARLFNPRCLLEWKRAQTVHSSKNGRNKTPEQQMTFDDQSAKPIEKRSHTATATSTATATTTPKTGRADPPLEPMNLLNPLSNAEISGMVDRIAILHPRNQCRSMQASEVPDAHRLAIVKAMKDEIALTDQSAAVCLDMMLARVVEQAGDTPPDRWRYFKEVPNYFALHEYRLESSHFNREDKPHHAQSRTAINISERHRARAIRQGRRTTA